MPATARITLVAVGTRGDVQPMLALALELRRRGHEVRLGAPPDFESWIRGFGIEFGPVGADMRAYLARNPALFVGSKLAVMAAGRRFLGEQLPVQARETEALCEGADAVVWGGVAIGALLAAEKLGLPVLGVLYTTSFMPSDEHPPMSMPWQGLPRWGNRALWALYRRMTTWLGRTPVNRTRAALGLPPIASVRDYIERQCPYAIAADPVLFPPDPHWPPSVRCTGFIHFDDEAQSLDAGLSAWLDEGEPPIFIGFGSMGVGDPARLEATLRDAIVPLGRRCLLGAGWAGLGARGLPAGWRIAHELPHPALFPRVAAVVHHGGSGTTANALRAGVPQLILPLILDQFHHAQRLHLAGLMPRPVPLNRIDARQLADGLRFVLEQPAALRESTAARLRQSQGRAEVARMVEQLIAQAH